MYKFISIKGALAKCIGLSIAVCFLFSVAHVSDQPIFKHVSHYSEKAYDIVAVMPDAVTVPVAYARAYSYPANDVKPVNTNYQLIRFKTLGLLQSKTACI